MIIDYVRRKHANPIVPVYSSFIDVYYFIADNIKKNIPINEIRNLFYTKWHTLFRICKGKCKDQDRMNASLQSIENNINLLKTEVTGVPIQIVFNIDEIGSTDFADERDVFNCSNWLSCANCSLSCM